MFATIVSSMVLALALGTGGTPAPSAIECCKAGECACPCCPGCDCGENCKCPDCTCCGK